MMSADKIQSRHRSLKALVYIRQSTPKQVLTHQESTRRQYQLAERAQQLGWPAPQIQTIDEDLGLSGTSSHQRTGFQRLVASISLGEVGLVLVTEVSRLSRLNSDWHRVIELCAVFHTLIADEDGIYEPGDPNDRLLLGVKGTLFAAELHILYSRMRGNLLNKARRGELALRLPVGYRRLPDGQVVLDPDEEVRRTLELLFAQFASLRSARAVQRYFHQHQLKIPRLVQYGPGAGQLLWVRPTYQMVQQVLTNPVYAGTFVYGRRKREAQPGDPPVSKDRRRPLEEWDIVVPNTYPAYLSYEQYLVNRQYLRDNLYNFEKKGRGAAREGVALLQGLLLCGRCGRRMTVSHGSSYHAYQCRRAQMYYAERQCQGFGTHYLDQAVSDIFLEAMQPAGLETMLAAFAHLEQERQTLDQHWQRRRERARYEVERARRQYDAVDPGHRLVARELEKRWDDALQAQEQLEQEYALVQRTELLPLSEEDQELVRQLAADLPGVWRAETTTAVDRKRLLRLVLTEVTLTTHPAERSAEVTILWCGGAITQHHVQCPPIGWHMRTKTSVVERLRCLAQQYPDHRIAEQLNAEGILTQTGKPWTNARVYAMRKQYRIPTACPVNTKQTAARADQLMPAKAAARLLGVSPSLIQLWVQQGVLVCDQRCPASKLWVRVTTKDIARLNGSTRERGLLTKDAVMKQHGISQEAVWALVRQGRYVAYRVAQGQHWEWRFKRVVEPNGQTRVQTEVGSNEKGTPQYE
jgi:DNA invertase Pin-like site-specific DNA recombinase